MRRMSSTALRILGPEELAELATGLAAQPQLWRPHVGLGPGETRAFHRLVAEDHATVWLICWGPGADTGFHDHDGAAGAVAVCEGAVCEERLRIGGPALRRVAGAGDLLEFGGEDIHRVTYAGGFPAVTVHAYSPALTRMGQYVVTPDGVLLRKALDEDTELVGAEREAVAV
jgi:predicted metal-dependent enzyme (double-stranded beta helix superfamily)